MRTALLEKSLTASTQPIKLLSNLENNTHYLLHKGWNGLWIEGSKKLVTEINQLFKKPIDEKRLSVINAFVTKNNIDALIKAWGGMAKKLIC